MGQIAAFRTIFRSLMRVADKIVIALVPFYGPYSLLALKPKKAESQNARLILRRRLDRLPLAHGFTHNANAKAIQVKITATSAQNFSVAIMLPPRPSPGAPP